MARRGENIYKRKDGRWEGRYIKDRDLSDKALYGYVYARTYNEVKDKLFQAKQMSITECKDLNKNTLFKDVSITWLNSIQTQIKQSSYVKYYNILYNHIIPKLGECKCLSISTGIIARFTEQELLSGNITNGEELSPKTMKDILSVLKMIIKYANQQGIAINCSFDAVDIKANRKIVNKLSTCQREELSVYLIKNLTNINLGILIAIYTGIRIGELCALTFDDISIKEKALNITKTMQRIQSLNNTKNKTDIVISSPKSYSSIRKIPIPDFIIDIIIQNNLYENNAYILTGKEKQFIEPRTMENKLNTVLKKCNISGITFHTLRHTFATDCIDAGVDAKTLSEILGHSSVNITLNRYVHPSPEIKRMNMEKFYSYTALSPSLI